MPSDHTSDERESHDRPGETDRDGAEDDPERGPDRRARERRPDASEDEDRPAAEPPRRETARGSPRSRHWDGRDRRADEHDGRTGRDRRRSRRARPRSNGAGDRSHEPEGRSRREEESRRSNPTDASRSGRGRGDETASEGSTGRQLYRPVGAESDSPRGGRSGRADRSGRARNAGGHSADVGRTGRGDDRRGAGPDARESDSRLPPGSRRSASTSRYVDRDRTRPLPGDERGSNPEGTPGERSDLRGEVERGGYGRSRYDQRRVPYSERRDERDPPTERERERSRRPPY